MELTYANNQDLKDGWLLSHDLLVSIQEFLTEHSKVCEAPSLEQIEGVLTALKMVSSKADERG